MLTCLQPTVWRLSCVSSSEVASSWGDSHAHRFDVEGGVWSEHWQADQTLSDLSLAIIRGLVACIKGIFKEFLKEIFRLFTIVALKKTTWFNFHLMKTGFLFFVADHLLVGQLCTSPNSDRRVWKWHNVQRTRSESATVQLMHSTDPSYENRTIASTLKMQIRSVQRLRAQFNASDDPLEVVERKAT